MTRQILTYISPSLYNLIIKEKKKLQGKEKNKVKSRRKRITMVVASQSIARRVR